MVTHPTCHRPWTDITLSKDKICMPPTSSLPKASVTLFCTGTFYPSSLPWSPLYMATGAVLGGLKSSLQTRIRKWMQLESTHFTQTIQEIKHVLSGSKTAMQVHKFRFKLPNSHFKEYNCETDIAEQTGCRLGWRFGAGLEGRVALLCKAHLCPSIFHLHTQPAGC